jgi:hypothetical protein
MSKRMIDLLFTQGAMELDRRDNSLHPWSIDMLRDGGAACSGQRLFDDAEVLVVDNVTRYLYEVCEQEERSGDDYPNCAPPFPTFWVETRAPAYSRSGRTVVRWGGQHAWGALFVASEMPENLASVFTDPDAGTRLEEMKQATWQTVVRTFAAHQCVISATPPPSDAAGRAWFAALPVECRQALQIYGAMHRGLEGIRLTGSLPAQVRWHYTIFTFVQLTSHDIIRGPVHCGTALVSPNGQLVELPTLDGGTQFMQWGVAYGEYLSAEERRQVASVGNVLVMPMWLALSFLHCKNVTLTKEDPCHMRKPPKRGEACRRLHYHVLNIHPMQEVLRREGHSHTTGLKQALHICRGHFKDYRQRGLFGKYQGLFWWDAHIRGRSSEGVVIKDYSVQRPVEVPAHA